jgi:hypothetical protein
MDNTIELKTLIDETVSRLANQLHGPSDSSAILRRLFDRLAEETREGSEVTSITAPNAVIEVIDERSGKLYRRYLELGYEENDNGIRLSGENIAGEEVHIAFLSDTALLKMKQLRGGGPNESPCTHKK